jgi:uncharacterized membrane protein YfhO
MEFTFARKKDRRTYLHYTVLFLVLAACMFGPYLISGHSLIWNTDAANQHLPLLVKYREYVLSFLRHLSQGPAEWSWTMGLGSDLFSVFSYYTIGDVFAYLALLISNEPPGLCLPADHVLRLYCVGLAFVYFARHFDFKDGIILIGSGSTWSMPTCFTRRWPSRCSPRPLFFFPLIVVQLERVLQGGSAWPLFGVFVWMLVSNYYLAFVLGLGAICTWPCAGVWLTGGKFLSGQQLRNLLCQFRSGPSVSRPAFAGTFGRGQLHPDRFAVCQWLDLLSGLLLLAFAQGTD